MSGREREKQEANSVENDGKILCFAKEMLPCKFLFFFMDAAMLASTSFTTLFYISSGLTVDKVGYSGAIGNVVSFIVAPMWGSLTDKMKKNRILFLTSIVLATTAIEFSKPWIVMSVSKHKEVTTCTNDSTPLNSSLAQLQQNCTTHVTLLNPDTLWFAVTAVGVLASFVSIGQMCYIETAVIKTVFTRKRSYSYGEQKVFGPLGAGMGAFLAGVCVDNYHPKHLSPYFASYYLFVPLSLMLLPLLYIITKQANWDYGRRKKGEQKIHVMKEITNVFKNLNNVVFFISVLVSGTSIMVILQYLFVYMKDEMNPSNTVMGLSMVISMFSELAIYPFSSKIIQKVGGQMRCIIIGISSTALRLALLSFCTKPWQVFLIQPLHGIGMSLGWTAMIEHTWAIFPKEITTTGIGVLVNLHWVIPALVSTTLGAYLYKTVHGPVLFRGIAILDGCWVVFLVIYFEIFNKAARKVDNVTPCPIAEDGTSNDAYNELEESTGTIN